MAFGDFTVARNSVKYVTDASGDLAEVAVNTPAFEFNADGTYKGLLPEPQGVNQIRNNTMVGAVVGTPGTLPTNYGQSLSGLTREVVDIGVESGFEYIDLRFHGTATGTVVDIAFETNTQIVATPSQVWTASSYLKVVADPAPPISYQFRVFTFTSAEVALAGFGTTIQSVTSTLTRFSETITTGADATTARVRPNFRANIVNGDTYDFTVRIGLPQMETSSVATSVIKTSGSTVTRFADAITLTGASSLIGQTSGSVGFTFVAPAGYKLFMSGLSATVSGVTKVRFFYSTTEVSLHINDVLVQTKTGTYSWSTMDDIELGHYEGLSQVNTNIQLLFLTA